MPRKQASKRAPGKRPPARIDLGSGVTVERGVRFRLRDGTVLISDHYYPPGQGPAPTLLVRQPYGRAVATTVVYAQPAWFAAQGYNVVIQDVRGRGDSTGEFYPFRYEGKDGAATIDWLASRPECNGRIGMYGFSYQGLTQLLAAAEQPAALKCIAPAQTAGDLFHGWFYHHGAFRLASGLGWATQMLKADARRLKSPKPGEALEAAWLSLPSAYAAAPYGKLKHLSARGLPAYYRDWTGKREAGAWWARHDISTRPGAIQVPALHVWGWFDTYLHGSELLYRELCEKAGTAEARANQYLIAGPWTHIPWSRYAGETDLGPAAMLDTDAILLRWFNHWLKDSGEFAAEPKIRAFALGENRWHSLDSWPGRGTAPGSPALTLFLHSAGRANSSKGDGVLSTQPPPEISPRDMFVYEPEVPAGAPGPNAAPGQFNQARADAMNNVLVYTGPAVETRVHVCGTPRLVLYATSRSAHADLFARLERVLPDGRALNVCHGIARSSWLFRKAGHQADTIQRWEFDLEPTSCTFSEGERIRLVVSGSAFPLYDRNPGSAIAPHLATPRDWMQNQQQILHDEEHPSCVALPIVSAP